MTTNKYTKIIDYFDDTKYSLGKTKRSFVLFVFYSGINLEKFDYEALSFDATSWYIDSANTIILVPPDANIIIKISINRIYLSLYFKEFYYSVSNGDESIFLTMKNDIVNGLSSKHLIEYFPDIMKER